MFNGLVFFYNTVPGNDLGVAILFLTFAVRGALAPLFWRAQQAQKNLALLQPEIARIQEKNKNDRAEQSRALMALYAERKVNPFSGCFVALVQLPLLIALFHVFSRGLAPESLDYLYSFVANPGMLNPISFGLIDLSKGNVYIGIVAAVSQFFQTKMTTPPPPMSGKGSEFSAMFQKQMLYIFPAMILLWSYTFPSALTFYWTALSFFGIVQEVIMRRVKKNASGQ